MESNSDNSASISPDCFFKYFSRYMYMAILLEYAPFVLLFCLKLVGKCLNLANRYHHPSFGSKMLLCSWVFC